MVKHGYPSKGIYIPKDSLSYLEYIVNTFLKKFLKIFLKIVTNNIFQSIVTNDQIECAKELKKEN